MSGRGAVVLVVADNAYRKGLFELTGITSPIINNLYSSIVIMAIIITLTTPII